MNAEPTDSSGPTPSRMAWLGLLLGLYALGAGTAAWGAIEWRHPGWAWYTRPLLGTFGIWGGLLLLVRSRGWMAYLVFWALLQVPVVILDPSGPLTQQPGVQMMFKNTTETFSGLQLEDWLGFGVNLAGVVLLLVVVVVGKNRWHPAIDPANPSRFGSAVHDLAIAWSCLVLLAGGGLGARYLLGREAALVVNSQLPGTSVYFENQWAGLTPLYLSREKLVELGLCSAEGTNRVLLLPVGPADSWVASGDKRACSVGVLAPWFCRGAFQHMPTPHGARTMTLSDAGQGGRAGLIALAAKQRAGLVLSQPDPRAQEAGTNSLLAIPLELRFNPPDRGAPGGVAKSLPGSNAVLRVTFSKSDPRRPGSFQQTGLTNVSLPESWACLGPGDVVSQTLQIKTPATPGLYYYSCAFIETGPPRNPNRLATPFTRCFGSVQVK